MRKRSGSSMLVEDSKVYRDTHMTPEGLAERKGRGIEVQAGNWAL